MLARGDAAAGAAPLGAETEGDADAAAFGRAAGFGFYTVWVCAGRGGGCSGLGTPTRYCQPKTTTIERTMAMSKFR